MTEVATGVVGLLLLIVLFLTGIELALAMAVLGEVTPQGPDWAFGEQGASLIAWRQQRRVYRRLGRCP